MKSKKELIAAFADGEENKLLLASLLDKEETARMKGIPSCTRFMTPEQQAMSKKLLDSIKAEYHIFGGYEGAERAVICFLPEYLDELWIESADGPVAAIKASYKGNLKLGHRDFLGSLMGTGIVREAVGDITVWDNICYFIVLRELVPFVIQNMTSAGRAVLTLEEREFSQIPAPEIKLEEKKATVMSMRLDAVLSAAFNVSRDSAAQCVNSGRVSLNHILCVKGDKIVKDGDIISVKGMGKVQIFDAGTISRRGRKGVIIKKYV